MDRITRRFVLAALGSTAIAPTQIWAKSTKQAALETLLETLAPSGRTSIHAVDLRTGQVVASVGATRMMPIASVTKSFSAAWALAVLGEAHQFQTRLTTSAPMVNGRLSGNLSLIGSGDPTLDADALFGLVAQLKDRGISHIGGAIGGASGGFVRLHEIDPSQPDHVSYNPALSGLNLNFNRAQFVWTPSGGGYGLGFVSPSHLGDIATRAVTAQLSDRSVPVFEYIPTRDGPERWSVAQNALGDGGRRWLPVRRPEAYAVDVFQTILNASSIQNQLSFAQPVNEAQTVIARHRSAPLADIVRDMMKYSTNLTAEMLMLSAARAQSLGFQSLSSGAAGLEAWLASQLGLRKVALENGSGLSERNRASASDLVQFFGSAKIARDLAPLLKTINIDRVEKDRAAGQLLVRAKTGTLNFVSALAGYSLSNPEQPIAFAILSADEPARDRVPAHKRDNPDGGKAWLNRARFMQREVLRALESA